MNTATFADGTEFRFDRLGGVERNEALPGAIEVLHRDAKGYVLVRTFVYLDGRRLGPEEDWHDLTPELAPIAARKERDRRIKDAHHAQRLSLHDAVLWCVRVCLPPELVGYVLDCLPGPADVARHGGD